VRDEELERMADAAEGAFQRRRRVMEDFRYDEQQEKFWDTTTGNLLGPKSVNGAIHRNDWPTKLNDDGEPVPYPPAGAINDIDTGLTVEGSTWWPGRPRFLENIVVTERGAMDLKGAVCYNAYIPPNPPKDPGDVTAEMWVEHVKRLYPDPVEHEHFFDFAAHMIQRPDEKVNHGVVMAGAQGIGKDTALLPLRRGVGEWNAAEISPDAITSAYNGYLRSVLLVINEVRPHDEDHKASNFYNMLKPLLAAPPDMLPMTLKYANTIYVRNLCHVVLTTNDPLTMYIPPEDRRLFVMTSPLPDPKINAVFPEGYFERLHAYLAAGGTDAVIRWLAARRIWHFGVSSPPPKTAGKKAIIESAHQVRRTMVDDLFEAYVEQVCGGAAPEVVFHADLSAFARACPLFDDANKINAFLNAKNFHFKMAERGYDMLRSETGPEWKSGKFRSRMAFVSREVPASEQYVAAQNALGRRPLDFGRLGS
jgi:hypothetical protein